MLEEGSTQISVSVRVRPKLENTVNERHRAERYEKLACTTTSDVGLRLWDGKLTKDSRSAAFSFDNVFDMDTPQSDLYEAAAVDAVDAALAGTNASILTYGQTGSGKTYTVLGGIQNNPLTDDIVTEDTGVLMRAIEELLHYAAQMRARKKRHVVLGISVVEIYLDEIRDLLNPKSTQGSVVSAAVMKDVVRLPGLTYAPLDTLVDAMEVYKRAAGRRVQRATSANDTSSRSHAVFSIDVFQMPFDANGGDIHATGSVPSLHDCLRARDAFVAATLDPQQRAVKPVVCELFSGAANPLLGCNTCPIMHSKLTIADLAGSEKAKHADVRGEGFEELRKINSSLTALGNVVHSLFQGARHIPYRDSKLTMVLRDTFAAPSARISLIVNLSPTVLTFDETLSSLYFADKVKAMKVKQAANAHDAKMEEAYLASLHAHDAVLADMHIFACEQELQGRDTTFLAQAAALPPGRNPLFFSLTHTAVPDDGGRNKAASLAALCDVVKAHRGACDAAARTEHFLKEQHKQAKEEALAEYVHARSAVKKELKEVTAMVQATQLSEKEREAKMVAVLQTNHTAYTVAHTTRQERERSKKEAMAKSLALQKMESQVATQMQALAKEFAKDPALHRNEAELTREREAQQEQDRAWSVAESTGPRAVEMAELRREWLSLYLSNRLTSAGRGNSAASAASLSDTETWLRSAVLAMAGNAVVQSQRRQRKAVPAVAAAPGFLGGVDTNRPPKYWTQKRIIEEEQKKQPLRHSAFDDPQLSTTISAFMDMGGTMKRLSRDGTLHQRLFYVAERHGRRRLCWDEESPGQQQAALRLGGMGHVELCTVTRIILGQGTPTFARCRTNVDYFTSFSLEYGASSSKAYLDLVCGSVREMETWVIGLSQSTGLTPVYVGTSQPDGIDADGAAGAVSAPEGLSYAALRLTQEWHIPVATLVEATAQVNARRMKRASQVMAITPGELASVTKLDIFRGSALWLHLQREGLVKNPCSRLYCYVKLEGDGGDNMRAIGQTPSPVASGSAPSSASDKTPSTRHSPSIKA